MRKATKITGYVLSILLLLFLAAALAVQSSAVQTFIGKNVVKRLAGRIDGDITFDKIQIKPFDVIVLKDVVIKDRNPYRSAVHEPVDTFVKAASISARFSIWGLFLHEGIHVSRAKVTHGALYLSIEPQEDRTVNNLSRIFRIQPSEKEPQPLGSIFDAKRVEVDSFHFRMVNFAVLEKRTKPREHGIDWADLDLITHVKAHDLRFSHGIMSGTADEVYVKEKSGLELTKVSGRARAGQGETAAERILIQAGRSEISIPEFVMSYPQGKNGFSDFINHVKMDGTIAPSVVDMGTIAYFAPALWGNAFCGPVQGTFSGLVKDFSVDKFVFQDGTSGVNGNVKCRITGLPDIRHTWMDFEGDRIGFDASGIAEFIREWAPGAAVDFSRLASGNPFTLHAKGHGTLNKLAVEAQLRSDIGEAEADIELRNAADPGKPLGIGGLLTARNLHVGKLVGSQSIGLLSAASHIDAAFGERGPEAQIDYLKIHRLNVSGYDYSGIEASGRYRKEAFEATVSARDPNLQFTLHGSLADSRYKMEAEVLKADLQAMNLDKRGPSKVSFKAEADLIGENGSILIDSLVLENEKGPLDIGRIELRSIAREGKNTIALSSSFLDGFLHSSHFPSGIVRDLVTLTAKQEMPALYGTTAPAWNGGFYEASLNFHDSRKALAFAWPGLYIADKTAFTLKVDREGTLTARLNSPRIALQDKYLCDLVLSVDNGGSILKTELNSSEAKISSVSLRDFALSASADDDRLQLGGGFKNDEDNNGTFSISGEILDGPSLKAVINPSPVRYNGDLWQFQSSDIRLLQNHLSVQQLTGECGDQSIRINGALSKEKTDTLEMNLEQFNIGLLNSFFAQDFQLGGSATGRALVISPSGIAANLVCSSTMIAGYRAGTLQANSSWNASDERFDIVVRNELDGKQILDIDGNFTPSTKGVNLTARFDNLNIGFASPALASMFSDMNGGIYGQVHADGTFDNLEISSEDMRFEDAHLTLDFTRVPYTVNGPFSIDNRGLLLDNVIITDRHDGIGVVNGGIRFDHFKDMKLDMGIRLDRIEALATTRADNSTLYGDAYATGDISLTGPFDDIQINIHAATSKDGTIHIPIGSSTSGTAHLLTFKEEEKEVYIDPYLEMMNRLQTKKRRDSNLAFNLKIDATPAVDAFVEIGGNVLTGRGAGTIDIAVDNNGLFTLGGNYSLISGNFHLSLLGLTSKEFSIENGSSIRFNGDVMDSDLDIKGVFRTKTTLNRLLADTSSVSTRRLVECGIDITDKLRNPQVKFSINIPDLDPTTQARVESALNTEDKIQKQFLSLLVSGSFIPNEESGIVNNSNVMFSSLTEIMASQLNYIFSRLDIPLDLGLTYQSTNQGYDMFDVAVSTQLFNNRVIVNGTIGNKNYARSNQSEVVGDIDIEVKLNKPGTLRLNVFSHSADEYTNYLDNSQRNGAGISYQREFNTFRQFLKELFTSRKKRRRAALTEIAAPQQRTTIEVGEDGKIRKNE